MADNANSGMAFVALNGQTYRVVGELTWDPGQVDRETQKGMDGIHGKKLTPRVPFMSMVFRDSSDLKVADINTIDGGTIFAQLISGKTVTGSGLWQVGPTEVNSEEGTFTARFEGGKNSVREGTV